MKTNKKTKSKEKEYWVDELLGQPENHKNEPDGSTLYGYWEETILFSQGWWLNTKNAIVMVWAAKNPFYENAKFESGCAAQTPSLSSVPVSTSVLEYMPLLTANAVGQR